MFNLKIKAFFISLLFVFSLIDLSACDNNHNTVNEIPPHKKVAIHKKDLTSTFDYYVLALSWSPEYCKDHMKAKEQCGRKPEEAYRFILHGLWPSNEEKKSPAFCSHEKLDDALVEKLLPITPSKKLIKHEWEKHGTCSGLDAQHYVDLAIASFSQVTIPDFFNKLDKPVIKKAKEIEALIIEKNPKLEPNSIRIVNKKGDLSEVRVCLDNNALVPIRCPFPSQTQCDAKLTILPPA